MQKLLLTCFLALLCLVGRYLVASSKVADSPTEAPNHPTALHVSQHSGDTHRGGTFSRPDTFHSLFTPLQDIPTAVKLDDRAVNQASFSPFRGSGGTSGHPTSLPSPVFGLPSSPNQTASFRTSTRSDVINLPSSVSRLLSSNPSSALDSTFLFLRVELESSPAKASPSLGVTLSSQELDARYDYVLQVQDSLRLTPGEFLAGTMGLQLGEMKMPLQAGLGRLQIELDGQSLLQDIWVQANDSLRLSMDRRTGKLLFLGPHKEKFRLQVQLQDLASAWTKTINPIMLSSSKERILDSPEKAADYQRIAENQSFGWNRKMELLAEDSERLDRAKFLLNSAGQDHPVFQELKRYRGELDPDFYNWLWLFWKGKLRKQALDFMLLTQASSPEWGQLLLENALEAEELIRVQSLREFPMEFTEALYVEHYLLEIYTGISFTHLTETLPADLQNQVNAFFLVRQYKDLADADSLISGLLSRTESPWIKEYLHGILLSKLRGSEFINEPFWNEQGEPVYPESWKGKLVFLDFWLSGCGACLAFAKNKFLPLLDEFGSHPDILFVTITGDSDRELWKSTLAKNQLTRASTLNLYAGGVSHPALKQYHIQAFPEQLLLDKEGKILQTGGFPSDLQGWKELLYTYLNGDTPKINTLTQPLSNN